MEESYQEETAYVVVFQIRQAGCLSLRRRRLVFQRGEEVSHRRRPIGEARGGLTLPRVRLDALEDSRRESDGVAAFFAIHSGFSAGRHAANEMFQLRG